jgi:hypothetical protein
MRHSEHAAGSGGLGVGRAELERSYVRFLARWPWDYFVTLTFRNEVGPATADRRFRRFIARIEDIHGGAVQWVKAQTLQRWRGVPHVHALLLGAGGLESMMMIKWWGRNGPGWARMRPIYEAAGAIRYLVGHIGFGAEIDFSAGLRISEDPNDWH